MYILLIYDMWAGSLFIIIISISSYTSFGRCDTYIDEFIDHPATTGMKEWMNIHLLLRKKNKWIKGEVLLQLWIACQRSSINRAGYCNCPNSLLQNIASCWCQALDRSCLSRLSPLLCERVNLWTLLLGREEFTLFFFICFYFVFIWAFVRFHREENYDWYFSFFLHLFHVEKKNLFWFSFSSFLISQFIYLCIYFNYVFNVKKS